MPGFDPSGLRRAPDVEGPDLPAHDAADRLILDDAAEDIARLTGSEITVVGDSYGALTLGLAATGLSGIRVVQDLITGERALQRNAEAAGLVGRFVSTPLSADAFRGSRLVLARMPRDTATLADLVELVAASAEPDAVLYAGGRLKHMTPTMNPVFERGFARLDIGRARQKSRVLRASGRRDGVRVSDRVHTSRDAGLDLAVSASAGVFAGTRVDIGTRFLLETLEDVQLPAGTAVDLGCGTGVIAAWLARRDAFDSVIATDRSSSAIESAGATADANGVGDRVHLLRDDNAGSLEPGSVDVVVCNPPFHSDGAVTEAIAQNMLAAAGRILRPGGQCWTVFNSPLAHPSTLRRLIGPTAVVARNTKFTVTRSTRGDATD